MHWFLEQKKLLCSMIMLATPVLSSMAASNLLKAGSEFRILPTLSGDQFQPHMSFNAHGGYVVTQDNSVDGNGLGIRGRRFFADLSGRPSTFVVNAEDKGDQQNGSVAMQSDGGAVFAWESSSGTGRRVFIRFMTNDEVFRRPESAASESVAGSQGDAALAVLPDDSAVIVWSEWDRDGHMQGVFGQKFSPTGARMGPTFQVNQVTLFNQRTPTIAALSNGSFVVAWITEEQRYSDSVDAFGRVTNASIDIYGRLFDANCEPLGSEYRLATSEKVCANPALVAVGTGFRAAWSARSAKATPENWDVETRAFNSSGVPAGPVSIVNNTVKGDQFRPKVASVGNSQLVVWTSYGQDGADEGVFARVVQSNGEFDGNEFLVNTTTRSKQIQPAVAAAGEQRFLVSWASFQGGMASFDLQAQRYGLNALDGLAQPPAPFVSSLSQNSVCVSWPSISGQNISSYWVYVDDESTPIKVAEGNMQIVTRTTWTAGSAHVFRIGYQLADGRISPVSDAVTALTWGTDANSDGLPDDWQQTNWGRFWPSASADSDGDGASNLNEFYAGTDPLDAQSVLRTELSQREQGLYLTWTTEPGSIYQVEVTSDLKTWQALTGPRFAPSTADSLPVTGPAQGQYYRVIRMR